MNGLKSVFAVLCLLAFCVAGNAAQPALHHGAAGTEDSVKDAVKAAGEIAQAATEHAEGVQHGLPSAAVPVFELGWFKITNSMIVTWIVALALIFVTRAATREAKLVPVGLQNFFEWMVEGLYNFFGDILGSHMNRKTFWFFATIFIFIMFTNWCGLLPGVGTVGWGYTDSHGHFHLTEPLFRGGNADLNMTSAMALIFFFLWTVWSLQELGLKGFLQHIFGSPGTGLFMGAILFVVGILEVVSILFRPVSLSFRLYGNIFAGENILESMTTLVPWLGWLLPVPFYFLELLVGLVQALVFALLTAVFTALMIGGDHGHGEGHAKHH